MEIKTAPILSLEDSIKYLDKENIRGRLPMVLTSGGFDPIHPGHISCIRESKKFGDYLIVVVNSDQFLIDKKGYAFQPHQDRCDIVSNFPEVDLVVKFDPSNVNDATVVEALDEIRPQYFTKGGDRTFVNTPEADICRELQCTMKYGIGKDKIWSSSDYLETHKSVILNEHYGVEM